MANSEWAEASNASDEGESEAKRAQWAEQYPAVRFTQALPVKLTDEEHAHRGKELEGALTEVENETRLAKEAALASKPRIELANVKVRALREIVRDGQEERAVQCERMFRIETNTVTEVRHRRWDGRRRTRHDGAGAAAQVAGPPGGVRTRLGPGARPR